MISPQVKAIYAGNMEDLEKYLPEDREKFSVAIRIMVGPGNEEGEEAFDLSVCSPQWLQEFLEHEPFLLGRGHLFINRYDPTQIRKAIFKAVERFSGDTWREVAEKISRTAFWEFEDYPPTPPTTDR